MEPEPIDLRASEWEEIDIARHAIFQLVLEEPILALSLDDIIFERVCDDCNTALFSTKETEIADAFALGTYFNDRLSQLIEKPISVTLLD